MPYYEMNTIYALYKKYLKEVGKKPLPWKEYYENIFEDVMKVPNNSLTETEKHAYARALGEYDWYKNGCPYYNVHPNLISRLCNTDLSKIPSNLFKLPHGFDSVQLRFKSFNKDLKFKDPYANNRDCFVGSIIICKHNERRVVSIQVEFIEYNDTTDNNFPPCYTFNLHLDEKNASGENYSLQQAVEQSTYKYQLIEPPFNDSDEVKNSYRFFTENLLRLCCTIGFLADNANICEPDLLTADKHLIETASPEELEALHQKARRKRKYGYNIGTDRMFLGPQPIRSGEKSQAAEGRELEYAHIRGGHPHAVRYGKGKELVKIMWYVPLTVRPDLPFKLESQANNPA